MKNVFWGLMVACALVASGCGGDEAEGPGGGGNEDAGSTQDGGNSGGGDVCTPLNLLCPDLSPLNSEVCVGAGNTACWYVYNGDRYTCATCGTADGCTEAANDLIAAACD